ncbi:type III-A CRISPR-associated protein Cas10/Csm1 [Synechococcus sp. PCC 7336]|uniref:type III-A CRISPR-associated protein Cas10/Csm1 n=1 Tax=Synechococcus sp. PCC 7336 TaxID=195250 RepID=UPI0003494799|nr:type III-A CRISPR-associated protein Cas10/Csm1 [Synechococcus sp. PCC 7336]
MTEISHQIALNIFQQALLNLAQWANTPLAHQPSPVPPNADRAIQTTKHLTQWLPNATIGPLKVIFDTIALRQTQPCNHYWPPQAIATPPSDRPNPSPAIPYPTTQPPLQAELDTLKQDIKTALATLTPTDWQNLPYLMLFLEKYGTYLSYTQPDIALYDLVKTTAAIASSLGNTPDAPKLSLIAGDLSGIQDFIYTIASDGALKSLRARSFTLELVTEEIVQQLSIRLNLPRSNTLYAGGGNLYLLAPANDFTASTVAAIRDEFNTWLFDEFQGKVFLSLAQQTFQTETVATPAFTNSWQGAIAQLSLQKSRKFESQLDRLLAISASHEPCKVCHRDDIETLKPLDGEDGVDACPTCRKMFALGGQLLDVGALVRSSVSPQGNQQNYIQIFSKDRATYYYLFPNAKAIPPEPQTVYLINNWDLSLYKFPHFENPTPLLLGNYGERTALASETGVMTAAEMAERATGIQRVGHLRMDVDRLGQIFAEGLGEHYTLPRLAGLSRQMSYFFKVYLNSLAAFRARNFLDLADTQPFRSITKQPRQELLFIYAGGDDLFVSGAWDRVVEFAFDVYQSFRAFTGWHPDITLSGGISLSLPKYPLYQSAADSGRAESNAKGNGRDSLGLFDRVFKWREWLGEFDSKVAAIDSIPEDIRTYIGDDSSLALFGVLPFVERLQELLGTDTSKGFVRNLLATAQLQEKWLESADKQDVEHRRDIRYFLHLPKVAYTLSRLPNAVKNAQGFDDISTSLKSPYNAPYFRAIATWLDLLNRSTASVKGIPTHE